jgi:hypothetical protein
VNPRVDPQNFQSNGKRVLVCVHQVVHSMDGTVIVDQMVKHVFTFEGGLVKKFEIA